MIQFAACVRKDVLEFLRLRKNLICAIVLLGIGAMVLCTTLFISSLLAQLSIQAPNIISDPKSISDLMEKLFPKDIQGSLKIFASDIGIFYSIVACFMCHMILTDEVRQGKWIIPLNAGIKKTCLIGSKCLVYSVGIGFPVFIVYIVYYYAASIFLSGQCNLSIALLNGAVLSAAVAGIVMMTLLLSLLYRHSVLAALSVVIVVMVAPDVLTFFSFGRWFPTYLLTFTYTLSDDIGSLLLPCMMFIVLLLCTFFFVNKKYASIELGDRGD